MRNQSKSCTKENIMMKKGRKIKVEEEQREKERGKYICGEEQSIFELFALLLQNFIKPHGSRRPVILFFAT